MEVDQVYAPVTDHPCIRGWEVFAATHLRGRFFDGSSQLPESRRHQRQESQPRGEFPLRYNEVIETINKEMNKFVWKLHILSKLVLGLLKLFKKYISHSPLHSGVGLTAER